MPDSAYMYHYNGEGYSFYFLEDMNCKNDMHQRQ